MRFKALGLLVVLLVAISARAETHSKQVAFEANTWVEVGLGSEGVEITDIRFSIEGGINLNPLRAGQGPQCIVALRNGSRHEMDLAVGMALFDEDGNLLGATEAGTPSLDPGEAKEITLTFREVKRAVYKADTIHVVLETFR